jgi:hypothetical protein
MGAYDPNRRARVLDPRTSNPIIVVMYGFMVSIHGFVLAVTSTMYLGLVIIGC